MQTFSTPDTNPLFMIDQGQDEAPLRNLVSPWFAFLEESERAGRWNDIRTVFFRNGRWIVLRAVEGQDVWSLIWFRDLRDRMLATAPDGQAKVSEIHQQDRTGRMEDWAIYDFDTIIKGLSDQRNCFHSKTG